MPSNNRQFTPQEREILSQSPFIQKVGTTSVVYGDLFKREFIRLYQLGINSCEIFEMLGLDTNIVGKRAVRRYEYRIKKKLQSAAADESMNAPPKSYQQEMDELKKENELLQAQVNFFKKKQIIEHKYRDNH